MPKTLRAFIALPMPDSAKTYVGEIQARLKSSVGRVRWVSPAAVHLTLAFLGAVEPAAVGAVAVEMDRAGESTAPLALTLKGVGGFPTLRRPRVLWIGLDGDLDRLYHLQTALATRLAQIGFATEAKRYRAHVTLGRTRRRIDPQRLLTALEPLTTMASPPFRVDHLKLYQSILKPTGAEHHPLHTAMLAGNPSASVTIHRGPDVEARR